MKRIIFVLLLISTFTFGQKIGDVSSPYSIAGWDTVYGYTPYYLLPIYRLLSNPGGWININQRMIDSLFNKLIVLVDSLEFEIINDSLRNARLSWGKSAFSTTDQSVEVTRQGMKATDLVIVQPEGTTITSNDVLSVVPGVNKFTVYRPASGTSGLTFSWRWIRKR